MTIGIKHRAAVVAIAAGALFAPQVASADTIQLSGFWAGSGSVSITFSGVNYHDESSASFSTGASAGGFRTYNLTTDPARQNSFQSWCVDIFHHFSFPVAANATLTTAALIFGQEKANDLGRLYTSQRSVIEPTSSSSTDQAAFQLAVWEIVNEDAANLYSLSSGDFLASGTGASRAAQWLSALNTTSSASAYDVQIWSVQQGPYGTGPQDVAVFAPIPEPETYAMLLAGLGLMGFVMRRRSRSSL